MGSSCKSEVASGVAQQEADDNSGHIKDFEPVRCRPERGRALSRSGWGGIRTHGTLARTLVFKTSALVHSATHPCREITQRRFSGV